MSTFPSTSNGHWVSCINPTWSDILTPQPAHGNSQFDPYPTQFISSLMHSHIMCLHIHSCGVNDILQSQCLSPILIADNSHYPIHYWNFHCAVSFQHIYPITAYFISLTLLVTRMFPRSLSQAFKYCSLDMILHSLSSQRQITALTLYAANIITVFTAQQYH